MTSFQGVKITNVHKLLFGTKPSQVFLIQRCPHFKGLRYGDSESLLYRSALIRRFEIERFYYSTQQEKSLQLLSSIRIKDKANPKSMGVMTLTK